MSQFLHDHANDDDAKAIAIPWVFSKNSPAKMLVQCPIEKLILSLEHHLLY